MMNSMTKPAAIGHERYGPAQQPACNVIAFVPGTTRRFRREEADSEPRGQILLFMGVRYERMPEPEPAPEPVRASKRKRS